MEEDFDQFDDDIQQMQKSVEGLQKRVKKLETKAQSQRPQEEQPSPSKAVDNAALKNLEDKVFETLTNQQQNAELLHRQIEEIMSYVSIHEFC